MKASLSKKIYLASSWRNSYQPKVLADLRAAGHDVYDFRNPNPEDPDNHGFSWKTVDPEWRDWTPQKLKTALKHPIAVSGHNYDHSAMEWCTACVLLLPSGNSAHLEAGWCAGRGKATVVYAPEIKEADLMYRSFDRVPSAIGYDTFCTEFYEVLEFLEKSTVLL